MLIKRKELIIFMINTMVGIKGKKLMRIAICDDNENEQIIYTRIVEDVLEKNSIDTEIISYVSGEQLLFDFENKKEFPEILLLDINMPGIDGIETAKKIRKTGYYGEIIFLTVSQNHMLLAFDVQAFHYVIKNVTLKNKIEEILIKAIVSVKEKETEYIMFNGIGEYRNVPIAAIKYFEIVKKIIHVIYDREEFKFISTMNKIEVMFIPYGFIRIHRLYIVSLNYIRSRSYDKLILFDGTEFPIGRKYDAELRLAMNKRKFENNRAI